MSASRWHADPVVIDSATMPAARRRAASLSVARSPASAPSCAAGPSARAVASSTAVLPAPGEPIRLIGEDAVIVKVLAVVARRPSLPARIRSCTSTGTTSCRRIHRNRTSRHLQFESIEHDFVALTPGAPASAGRAGSGAAAVRCRHARRAGPRAGTRSTSSGASSQMVRTRNVVVRGVSSATSTPRQLADADAHPCTRRARSRARPGAPPGRNRLHDRVLMHQRSPWHGPWARRPPAASRRRRAALRRIRGRRRHGPAPAAPDRGGRRADRCPPTGSAVPWRSRTRAPGRRPSWPPVASTSPSKSRLDSTAVTSRTRAPGCRRAAD